MLSRVLILRKMSLSVTAFPQYLSKAELVALMDHLITTFDRHTNLEHDLAVYVVYTRKRMFEQCEMLLISLLSLLRNATVHFWHTPRDITN